MSPSDHHGNALLAGWQTLVDVGQSPTLGQVSVTQIKSDLNFTGKISNGIFLRA